MQPLQYHIESSPLTSLSQGERAIIASIVPEHPLYGRLIDLGWTAGIEIECVGQSPLGDPIAYAVRGSVLALRREDILGIEIKKEEIEQERNQDRTVIALAGNPNVGKSTIFNALTGLHQHTGNWTGKTVECAQGEFRHEGCQYTLVDLPGTYSLSPHAEEENVACKRLLDGDIHAVGVVCDAGALSRNLILVLQIMQTIDVPMILILNLQKEARRRGISISKEKLEEILGIPVVAIEAREKKGIARVRAALAALCNGEEACGGRRTSHERFLEPERAMERPEQIAALAQMISEQVSEEVPSEGKDRDRNLDRVLTGRWTAFPIMMVLLGFLLWLTLAGVNGISDGLMQLFSRMERGLLFLMSQWGAPQWLSGVVVQGGFRTVGWVISVMLPPMAIFFPLFTILEDLGYLPRIAFNLDRSFARAKACGKQALTMCMGLGCNCVGVTGCRIIDSPRERRVALLTNSLVPCNGRFPTLIALVSLFLAVGGGVLSTIGSALWLLLAMVGCVVITLVASRILSGTLFQGEKSAFLLELPPYRPPKIGQVIVRSVLDRTLLVLWRAIVIAAPAGVLLWLLGHIEIGGAPLLSTISDILAPVGRLLGMDGAILLAFVLALPAGEIFLPVLLMIYRGGGALEQLGGMEGVRQALLDQGWTVTTAICTMIFLLFHWPCATTLWTLKKEGGGWRWALLGAVIPTVIGTASCLLIATLARLFF